LIVKGVILSFKKNGDVSRETKRPKETLNPAMKEGGFNEKKRVSNPNHFSQRKEKGVEKRQLALLERGGGDLKVRKKKGVTKCERWEGGLAAFHAGEKEHIK